MVRHRGQHWYHLRFTHRTEASLGPRLSLPARRNRHTNTLHAPPHGSDIYRSRRIILSRQFRYDVANLTGLAFLSEDFNWHGHVTSPEYCGNATRTSAVREDERCRIAHQRPRLREPTTREEHSLISFIELELYSV
jgi:hypothetical protein